MGDLNQQEIGERIRETRGAMTQKGFADLLGVGRTSVVRYEAGERMPDAAFIARASAVLGVDPIWLLTGRRAAKSAAPLAPDEAALLDNYRNSPPAGRDALKATSAALAQSCVATKRRTA